MYKSNYIRFPNNIFEPEKILVDDKYYTLFLVRFNNLYDLYDYLKSNPNLNRYIFRTLESETDDIKFAGKPYNKALEDLIIDYDPGYEEFLELQNDLNNGINIKVHKYETVRTVAGGHLNIPAYSAGSPLCYETTQRISKPRFIRIHVTLSYNCQTTKKQVLNRAIIITNILKALENSGYSVGLDTFELSVDGNELAHIIVQVKKHGERMNMSALYKSLCNVEFLRRILFRVLETLEVKNRWDWGYGSTCSEEFIRRALNFDDNDMFFDQPLRMGIEGLDLADDFESAINHLKLADKIDVERAKVEFREVTKKLELKK